MVRIALNRGWVNIIYELSRVVNREMIMGRGMVVLCPLEWGNGLGYGSFYSIGRTVG